MVKGGNVALTNLVEGTPVNLNNSYEKSGINFVVKGEDITNNTAYYKGKIDVNYVGNSVDQETEA